MKNIGRNLLYIAIVLSLAACQSMKVESGFDSQVDFSAQKTFTWSGPRPLFVAAAEGVNPTLESHLMSATRAELEKRGVSYVEDREQADMVVSFAVGRDQIRVGSYAETFQYSFARGRSRFVSHDFSESQLGIIISDTAAEKLIWFGTVRKGITGADQANIASTSARMVAAIMRDYPVKR